MCVVVFCCVCIFVSVRGLFLAFFAFSAVGDTAVGVTADAVVFVAIVVLGLVHL